MINTTDARMGLSLKYTLGFFLALGAGAAWCQTPAEPPQWTEDKTPPPPTFSVDKLIPIEMPPYVTLQVGVDPETVSVGADGVVRYVVVMRNASVSVNAAYEGIQCPDAEVKTYARASTTAGKWVPIEQPEWKSLSDNLPSRHAYAIAQQGACDGHAVAGRAPDIVRALKRGRKPYD